MQSKIESALANWQPQNIVEENYKQYYAWVIGTPDIEGLLKLAKKCPLSNGSAVLFARALYNSLTYQNILFENNCSGTSKLLPTTEQPKIELYPNPAKTSVKVNCENARRIDVLNIQGQCLVSKKVFSGNSTIETSSLPTGIYLVRVTTSDNKISSSKLIIE